MKYFFAFFHILELLSIFLSKSLTNGILFSISLSFVFKTVAVTEPLISDIFLLASLIFFSKICWSLLYWFMRNKERASGTLFSKLFTFAFSFSKRLYSLNLQERSIYQDLNYVLLFLNYSNQLLHQPIGSLAILAVKAMKYLLSRKLYVSKSVASFSSFLVASF